MREFVNKTAEKFTSIFLKHIRNFEKEILEEHKKFKGTLDYTFCVTGIEGIKYGYPSGIAALGEIEKEAHQAQKEQNL